MTNFSITYSKNFSCASKPSKRWSLVVHLIEMTSIQSHICRDIILWRYSLLQITSYQFENQSNYLKEKAIVNFVNILHAGFLYESVIRKNLTPKKLKSINVLKGEIDLVWKKSHKIMKCSVVRIMLNSSFLVILSR